MSDLHSSFVSRRNHLPARYYALQLQWMSESATCSLESIRPNTEVSDCILLWERWLTLQIPVSVLTKSSLGLPKYMHIMISETPCGIWNMYKPLVELLWNFWEIHTFPEARQATEHISRSPLTIKAITHTPYTVTHIQISRTFIFLQPKLNLQPVSLYKFITHRHVRLWDSFWWSLAFSSFRAEGLP